MQLQHCLMYYNATNNTLFLTVTTFSSQMEERTKGNKHSQRRHKKQE